MGSGGCRGIAVMLLRVGQGNIGFGGGDLGTNEDAGPGDLAGVECSVAGSLGPGHFGKRGIWCGAMDRSDAPQVNRSVIGGICLDTVILFWTKFISSFSGESNGQQRIPAP